MTRMNRLGVAMLTLGMAISSSHVVASTSLNYGTYLPRSHSLHDSSVLPFFEEVERETNGSVSFRMHSDGTVVGPRNSLSGVTDGVVDMAMIVDLYIPSELPSGAMLSELSLYPASTMAGTAAMTEMVLLHCEQCRSELHDADVKPLGFYSLTPYHLMCRSQVSDVDSIRGKRIKTVGAWSGLAASLDAIPVSISTGEMYEALNRGMVDCVFGSTGWLESYSLADVVSHVLDMEFGAYRGTNFLNMNLDQWNALSSEGRAAIRNHLPLAVARAAIAYDRDSDSALAEARRDEGMQLDDVGQDVREHYRELLDDEFERVVAQGEERGVSNARELAQHYLELLDKWEGIVAELDGSEEAFAAALDREIYQHVDF